MFFKNLSSTPVDMGNYSFHTAWYEYVQLQAFNGCCQTTDFIAKGTDIPPSAQTLRYRFCVHNQYVH